MDALYVEIDKMKKYIKNKDINAINKLKLNTIKENNSYRLKNDEIYYIEEYNYYTRLLKNIRKYLKLNSRNKILIKINKNIENRLIYILVSIDLDTISVGKDIDIRVLSGSNNRAYMDCTYYEHKELSSLYINNFRAIRANKGYGSIILKNLRFIVSDINEILINYKYRPIKIVEGLLVADENIISEKKLRCLYKKYGFKIDSEENISIII